MTSTRRPVGHLTAVVLGATMLLTACGGADPAPTDQTPSPPTTTSSGSAAGYNDVDVDFAQMMLVHHRGAVQMAGLALTRSTNPELLVLAEQIGSAQAAEVETLTAVLEGWGEEVPTDIAMEDMDHSQMDHESVGMGFMSGMVSDEQMANLEQAQGAAFDKLFLRLMRTHHGGALAMAEIERIDGEDAELVELARQMKQQQMAEIETIQALIKAL